jgi:UDP-N-acetylmuramoylalanine-D-glutamate ligase
MTSDFRGKRVTVMGLGSFGGGIGAVQYLAGHGAMVTVTDLKPAGELVADRLGIGAGVLLELRARRRRRAIPAAGEGERKRALRTWVLVPGAQSAQYWTKPLAQAAKQTASAHASAGIWSWLGAGSSTIPAPSSRAPSLGRTP